MAMKPITEIVSETEISEKLRKAFVDYGSTNDSAFKAGLQELTFWRTELSSSGKYEIYDDKYRIHQRKIRHITDI